MHAARWLYAANSRGCSPFSLPQLASSLRRRLRVQASPSLPARRRSAISVPRSPSLSVTLSFESHFFRASNRDVVSRPSWLAHEGVANAPRPHLLLQHDYQGIGMGDADRTSG